MNKKTSSLKINKTQQYLKKKSQTSTFKLILYLVKYSLNTLIYYVNCHKTVFIQKINTSSSYFTSLFYFKYELHCAIFI